MTVKIISMIPARLGSKRIPQKNIRLLQGKPLLQYAIEASIKSGCFDEVWVNSESRIIGELAEMCGAKFHKRPEELSNDTATNQEFTAEFLTKHNCDYLIMMNSTSPLLRVETVKRFCEFVKQNKCDTVLSVIDEYAECLLDGNPINFTYQKKINSQSLKPVSKIIWALTAWRREAFLKAVGENKCGTYSGNVGLFSIPKDEACDLDTLEDWAIAEGLFYTRNMKYEEAKYWSKKSTSI